MELRLAQLHFLLKKVPCGYFLRYKRERVVYKRGYAVPTAFLETIRFCRYTLEFQGVDHTVASRRLLGLAALEKRDKGPTRQAPGLELEDLKRLREVLDSGSNVVDRVGAGSFLCCVYGRARWSDVSFIDHVFYEEGRSGSLTLFTTEESNTFLL